MMKNINITISVILFSLAITGTSVVNASLKKKLEWRKKEYKENIKFKRKKSEINNELEKSKTEISKFLNAILDNDIKIKSLEEKSNKISKKAALLFPKKSF